MAIVTGQDVALALGLASTTSTLDDVADVADQLLTPYLAAGVLDEGIPSPVREAGVVIAIDVWQNRTAAGGQSVGIDGTPGPYRMGQSLLSRVSGLVGPWMHSGSDVA
jgi:hypothetical protein